MSDLYKGSDPHEKNLKNCPECNGEIKRDILQEQLEKGKWFFDAVQAVIYENKPFPPMP